MKMNEGAVLKGSEALQLYACRLATALSELTEQARRLQDETNTLAAVVADGSVSSSTALFEYESRK